MYTVQRSLVNGASEPAAMAAKRSRLTPSRRACSSMKLPVPAAQA